jgi:hypothetical protein
MINKNIERFAKDFAKKCKRAGNKEHSYLFGDGYTVYTKETFGDGNSICRVNHKLKEIQFNISIYSKPEYTTDFLSFLLIWCVIHLETKDFFKTDEAALNWLLSTPQAPKSSKILLCMIHSFYEGTARPTEQAVNRIQKMQAQIKNHVKNNLCY